MTTFFGQQVNITNYRPVKLGLSYTNQRVLAGLEFTTWVDIDKHLEQHWLSLECEPRKPICFIDTEALPPKETYPRHKNSSIVLFWTKLLRVTRKLGRQPPIVIKYA